MAVPSSGELELYGDIGTELGVAQSNVTLHGMSQTAGFTPPDAMSEFYGYSGVSSPLSTVLWTGNGASSRSITGVGFQPDLVWLKSRNQTRWHNLIDSVRGGSRDLYSNATNAEILNDTTGTVSSFNSDGFTVSIGTVNVDDVNNNGENYVAWCFKAGGAAVTNTSGSITSQVSANVEGGFSVVTCTATGGVDTIGHGLGVAPSVIIYKTRSTTGNWSTYHQSLGNTRGVYLNLTSAVVTSTFFWNNTSPTSDVFTAYGSAGNTHIAYCFAEKAGFSKFGTYTGNGSTNGPTITTGFEPAFVMVKCTSSSGTNWTIWDNKRDTSNPITVFLQANNNGTEASGRIIDFNATSFQLKSGAINENASGQTYIYMAFA